jgi:hypothetical protein
MATIQEVFLRLQDAKKEQRDIRKIYRDALTGSREYQGVKDEHDRVREHKKALERDIQEDFISEFKKLDALKDSIAADKELLSDMAITKYAKGETVEVTDGYDQEYDPFFSVTFKKR